MENRYKGRALSLFDGIYLFNQTSVFYFEISSIQSHRSIMFLYIVDCIDLLRLIYINLIAFILV